MYLITKFTCLNDKIFLQGSCEINNAQDINYKEFGSQISVIVFIKSLFLHKYMCEKLLFKNLDNINVKKCLPNFLEKSLLYVNFHAICSYLLNLLLIS